jgi:Protein of unknown function (DUF2934)
MKRPILPRLTVFEPPEDQIRKCAYTLWQEAGHPAGRDLDIWLAAKELVRHQAAGLQPKRTTRPPDPGAPRRRRGA